LIGLLILKPPAGGFFVPVIFTNTADTTPVAGGFLLTPPTLNHSFLVVTTPYLVKLLSRT